MQENKVYIIPFPSKPLVESEPYLKSCFNIQRRNYNDILFEALNKFPKEKQPQENNYLTQDILKFLVDNESILEYNVYNSEFIRYIFDNYEIAKTRIFLTSIIVATHLYIKIQEAPQIDLNEIDYYYDNERDIYKYKVRPEMLELYRFIAKCQKKGEQPFTLKCGSQTLKLDNSESWIYTVINNYLKTHLININSTEQAKLELEENYSTRTGRKTNKYQNILISGIDKLFQELNETTEITNEECRFIRDYLRWVRLPLTEEELHIDEVENLEDLNNDDQIKNIRSRIRYLRKLDYKPNWFDENNLPLRFEYW